MTNQNKTPIHLNMPQAYDASDLADAYSLAECDMQWMNTAITHVRSEIQKIQSLVKNGDAISQYHFSELITHLEMYEYLAENRFYYHAKEAEAYQAEWEANKKAVTL